MYIEVNGVKYHVNVYGQGEPLMLLHGFTGSQNSWKPFVPMWQDKFQLILVDLIGHGKTDHPNGASRYKMECVAFDLRSILEKLQIPKTHLLGYSMGGRTAL